MTKIFVDEKEIEVKEGQNLLHAALSHGYDLPYFCWHPSLGSIGACRQCAVVQYKDAEDKKGRLVMSCMTPVAEGARFSIDCEDAKSFRASVIEWLMTNHPHDCPVCDEGGECHLQDMTLMSGHNYRNYRFKKRTFKNQNLGPLINHEMNRCITCYRCVRYYRDLAGGTDLNSFSSSQNVFFGRVEDGFLESEFSGNLAEVCPTGVFTDKRFKENYTRKWDLQVAPSICQMCSLGCNITPGDRLGVLRRVQNRFHDEINGCFICDRGRFGHDFVNSKERIREPLARSDKTSLQKNISLENALAIAKEKCHSGAQLIGLASPRANLETNFALRELVGQDNFYSSEKFEEFECSSHIVNKLQSGLRTATLKEIEESDAVLILGEDLTNTAPMMAFSVRQIPFRQAQAAAEKLKIPSWNDTAIRNFVREKKGPIYALQTQKTKLDDVAKKSFHFSGPKIATIGFAIAHAISAQAPAPKELSNTDEDVAKELAAILKAAKKPVIIAGSSLRSKAIIDAASNICLAIIENGGEGKVAFVVDEVNSVGLHVFKPRSFEELNKRLDTEKNAVVITVENNNTIQSAAFVIALDYLNHKGVAQADLVLPAATFAEGTGTVVNNEGRAQRYYPPMSSSGSVKDSWKFLRWMKNTNQDVSSLSLDELTRDMGREVPILAGFCDHVQTASFKICGQKIPRLTSEASGRTAIYAGKTMHEPMAPQDPDSPYAFSMEGARKDPDGRAAVIWSPQWNSVQALNKFQSEIGGPLRNGPKGYRLFDGSPTSAYELVSQDKFGAAEGFEIAHHRRIHKSKMAAYSMSLSQCPSEARIFISSEDAREKGLNDGDFIEIKMKTGELKLPCEIQQEVPRGWLIVPEEVR